jgi:predicted DNA-binding WGR domain protein
MGLNVERRFLSQERRQPVTSAPFDKYDFEDGRMIELRRIDPTQNMRRFYRLDIAPDLFGGFLLMRQWGRIGVQGCKIAHRYDTKALATAALQRQAERKRRRGYLEAFPIPDAVTISGPEVLHDQ